MARRRSGQPAAHGLDYITLGEVQALVAGLGGSNLPVYSADVPAGATTTTVTHGLGTMGVIVEVWEKSTTPWTRVDLDIQVPTVNTITIITADAVTTGQYRVVVASSGGSDLLDSPWDYGILPRVRYTGTWPARASSIPAGYTGPVEYDSAGFPAAPSPSDRVTGDRWLRSVS